jgi:Glucanosyltransferase
MGAAAVPQFFSCGDYHTDFYILAYNMDQVQNTCVDASVIRDNNYVDQFRNYSVPTILTLGCQNGFQHDFSEVDAILDGEGAQVFSGVQVRDYFDDDYAYQKAFLGK